MGQVGTSRGQSSRPGGDEGVVQRLVEAGHRVTVQRLAVWEAIARAPSHPSVAEVFAEVHRRFPTVSMRTVYATVDTFEQLGLLRTVQVPGAVRLETHTGPHSHAYCERCGAVSDLPPAALVISPAVLSCFQTRSSEGIVVGLCPDCASNATVE